MTLVTKEWLTAQTLRLTLEGHSQAEIAVDLNISEGTVNTIIKELVRSDGTLLMQHEIALVCQRTGLSIKQLASNLAFINAIARRGFAKNKIDMFLQAWNSIQAEDSSLDPKTAAQIFFGICTLYLKNGVPFIELPEHLSRSYDELKELNEKIVEAKKISAQSESDKKRILRENNATLRDLNKFNKLRNDFQDVGVDFEDRDAVLNVLRNLKEFDKDTGLMIDELKETRSLKEKKINLESKCDQLEKSLVLYQIKDQEERRFWGLYYDTVKSINKLHLGGLNAYEIDSLLKVALKYQEYLPDLINDIETYGGLKAALFKKERDLQKISNCP